MSIKRLQTELINIKKDIDYFYSVEPNLNNFFEWNFIIIGPPDTMYEFGIFKGKIIFPKEYPDRPPKVYFISDILHPNVYKENGLVCISILHEGEDSWGYEHLSERWKPNHGVNSIMVSIISLFSDPNFESPANVDASVLWKDNKELFKNKIYSLVSKSQI